MTSIGNDAFSRCTSLGFVAIGDGVNYITSEWSNVVTYTAPQTHTHDFSGEWKKDATHHWHECTCGETDTKVAHSGGTATETQKAKRDLDYTIPRNYKTPLNDIEMGYCLSDVAILAEFSKYIFDTYIKPEKYIPMTKTGLLRREVKKAMG